MARDKKKLALIAGAASIIAAGAFIIINAINQKPVDIASEAAAHRTLVQTITINGKIEAGSVFDEVLGTSQKVMGIFKRTGDSVQAGETILKLDTTDLEYQLGKAHLSLEALKKSTAVSREQALLNLDNARNQYAQALDSYNDTKVLFDNGMASQNEFSASQTALITAENQVKSAEIQYKSLDISSGITDKKAQMDSLTMDIANLNRKIWESSIKSTIKGTVTILDEKAGQYPAQGSRVQVMDLSTMIVKTDVAQEDAVLLKPGQRCTVTVKGLTGQYNGAVSRISDSASETANSSQPKFQVEISIDNPNLSLKAGYEADILVKLLEKPDTLSVAYSSVKAEDNGKKYLFVIDSGKAVKRYVSTGIETADYIEILQGIKAGEQYIVLPPESLKEGELVKIK